MIMSKDETKEKKKYKIIIIGAGISGLSCAAHLVQNGISDLLILEARNRIGGRILSIDLGGQKVELGANWIHGILGNPVFELAIQNGLVNVVNIPKQHKIVAATEDGKQIPFIMLAEIYEAYCCFLKRCEEYFISDYVPPAGINSVGEHINLEIELYLKNVTDAKEKSLKRQIFDCLLKRETCISGCHSMNEIDLLELGSYTELQGGNIVLPSGYSSILTPLVKMLPEDNIVTNCPVKTIFWRRKTDNNTDTEEEEEVDDAASDDSDKTVTDVPITNPHRVKVLCENGKKYYADHVIVTTPLGVLKEHGKTMFVPELPQFKMEAIERLNFGTVDKIYLEYDRPFLNPSITEVMLLWETDEASSSSDDWITSNWFRKIYSFTKLTDTMLLGWISGKEAEFMETLTFEAVAEKCTEILRKFLKDPYVPVPKKCIFTTWKKQPYSKGSYTSIGVGASQDDIESIAQPLYSSPHQLKPSVLFAGEHTHSNFYSTCHGAYLSGRTAALAIYEPEVSQEICIETENSDLSSWLAGIALD
ncbi:spermine oxidase [Culicoides brevitarsis]|uniref:spermine oxidase n=1 Tax=Culicoides brevitarsis TaxID=469753 RepID=UPI00307B9016